MCTYIVEWYVLIDYVKDVLCYPYPYVAGQVKTIIYKKKSKFIMLHETGKDEMCDMPLSYDI